MVSTISTTRPVSRIRLGLSIPLSPVSLSTSIRIVLRQVCHQRRRRRTQQPVLRLPLRGGVEGLEKLHFSAREDRNRHAVAIDQAIAGQRCQPTPRRQSVSRGFLRAPQAGGRPAADRAMAAARRLLASEGARTRRRIGAAASVPHARPRQSWPVQPPPRLGPRASRPLLGRGGAGGTPAVPGGVGAVVRGGSGTIGLRPPCQKK